MLKKDGSSLISLNSKNFSVIYKMPVLEVNADEAFVRNFMKEFPNFDECIKECWNDPDRFKTNGFQVYRI